MTTTTATPAPATGWGRHAEPPVCLLYGPPDSGKTIAGRRAAPHNALIFGPPGATKGDFGVVGWTPAPWQRKVVNDLFELMKLLQQFAQPAAFAQLQARGIRWVLVDDISILADNSMPRLERIAQSSSNKYAKWTLLMDLLMRFRRLVRERLNMGVVITAHERGNYIDDGGDLQLGGPRFPSKGRTADLAKLAEIVARTGRRDGWRPWPLWDGFFGIGDEPERWFGRDRHGFAPPVGPANLRALLTVSGYDMPYPPGLEWMPKVAARVREMSLAEMPVAEVATSVIPKVRANLQATAGDSREARDLLDTRILWAFTDGIDEAVIIRSRSNRLDALMSGVGAPCIVPQPSSSMGAFDEPSAEETDTSASSDDAGTDDNEALDSALLE